MKHTFYHGTDRDTAEKILKEGRLATAGYLGVGVCRTFSEASHYAKKSLGCVIAFEMNIEGGVDSAVQSACCCQEGGLALHDEIGRPLKEVSIFNAKIIDEEGHSPSDAPEPIAVAQAAH